MSRDARTVRNQEIHHGFWGNLFRGATLALATVLALTLSFSPALAAKGGKAGVASDLQEKVEKESPSNSVRVLVNLDGGDPLAVAGKIKELGGEVRGHFRNVGVMVVDLPLGAVDSLAEVEGLDYVAPDRPVAGLASQLETTTGAALAYGGTTSLSNFSGIDGSGVGVAVLDSGIDPSHVDLPGETKGTPRGVFSLDFTRPGGLGRPYRHATHT